jgi:hypothetical protein
MFKYIRVFSLQFHCAISISTRTQNAHIFHSKWTLEKKIQHLPFIPEGSTVYLRINFTWSWCAPHSCKISSGRSSSRRIRSVKQATLAIKRDVRSFWDKKSTNKFYVANQSWKYSGFLRRNAVWLDDRYQEFREIVVSPKRQEPLIQRPSVECWRTGILSSSAARTSNVAGLKGSLECTSH